MCFLLFEDDMCVCVCVCLDWLIMNELLTSKWDYPEKPKQNEHYLLSSSELLV